MGFRTSYEWDAIYNGLSDNLLCAKAGIPGRRIIMAMEPNYAPDPGDWVCTCLLYTSRRSGADLRTPVRNGLCPAGAWRAARRWRTGTGLCVAVRSADAEPAASPKKQKGRGDR